jgi:hypothetical protein
MKRNTLIMAGIALVLAFCLHNSHAQTTNAPAPGQPGLVPAPPPGQRPMPQRPHQPRIFINRALNDLRMVKAELQRSQDDFGGHKESALEACDKAMLELEAVMKATPAPQPSPVQNPQSPAGGTLPPPTVRMSPPAAPPATAQPQP